ncbi:MAG TPA: DUF3515 family protein [Micromonosporaceae bacterium]|nr:DUF3515 family protein [Micromonosporaceae bacterium]
MDTERRRAARLATLIAVPVAVLVGFISYAVLDSRTSAQPPVTSQTLSTGSTSDVPMAAPSLSPGRATMCLAFIAALPTTLNNLAERRVTAGPEQNIAYGDPAITAACGVAPAVVASGAIAYNVGKVCWYEETGPDASVWTTLDREVPVKVTVPNSYASPGQWVTLFANALVASVPSVPTKFQCG